MNKRVPKSDADPTTETEIVAVTKTAANHDAEHDRLTGEGFEHYDTSGPADLYRKAAAQTK